MSTNFKKNKLLRNDETLALAFFAVATILSNIYGYSLRFYILTDIIIHYLFVFPIFLIFLFYAYIRDPYLKFGWTILALFLSGCLIFAVACMDIHALCEKINLGLILILGIFLWACSLIIYLLKKTKGDNPYSSMIKIKTLFLNIVVFIRDWAPIFVVLFSYCTIKSIIPVINPILFDEQFKTMDYILFFKHSPAELIIEWIPVSFMGFLSFGYKFYFLLIMFAFSSIYCNLKDKRVFYTMVIAFSITYILGLGLYLLFPGQGPIYHYPGAI